jgi:hypothetical protein
LPIQAKRFGHVQWLWRIGQQKLRTPNFKSFGLASGRATGTLHKAFDIFGERNRGGRLIGRVRIHVLILRLGAHIPL